MLIFYCLQTFRLAVNHLKSSKENEDISVSKQEHFNFDSVHLLSYRTILAEVILLILYIC